MIKNNFWSSEIYFNIDKYINFFYDFFNDKNNTNYIIDNINQEYIDNTIYYIWEDWNI